MPTPRLSGRLTTTGSTSDITASTDATLDKTGLDVAVISQKRGQTILFAIISCASSGSNEIVAAPVLKKIKVLNYSFIASGAVTVEWRTSSTPISGAMSFAANGGISTSIGSPVMGWLMETAAGQALNINLGSATAIRGHLSYFLEE